MIDMDQYQGAFLEESSEALDTMESALLNLTSGRPDAEAINTIFRVAHSIKGGAGMFGYEGITSFTHALETLLDELRAGRIEVTQDITDSLLRSVDLLREMLSSLNGGATADAEAIAAVQERLIGFVATGVVTGAGSKLPARPAAGHQASSAPAGDLAAWRIRFESMPSLLANGNDPLRMFSELTALGQLDVVADLGRLPRLAEIDPGTCVLAWDLLLRTAAPVQAIELIFEWAQGDCFLRIEPDCQANAGPVPVEQGVQQAEPLPQARPVAEASSRGIPEAKASPETGRPAGATVDSSSIRVSIEKIDELLNTVGEIVITQSMLSQLAARLNGVEAQLLCSGLAQLQANIRELQEDVMRVRMLPVSFVFSRFPRLVRDLARRLGKQIRLAVTGDQTELDKTILEKIGDPLVHLVRNSIDHGIETPEERLACGKGAEGTIHLHAFHKGGAITVEVRDDGRGLDTARLLAKARSRGLVGETEQLTEAQIHELIFMPGFSTADRTTDISGRGVGMDVVRRNIKDLGGSIELRSEAGKGTAFTITLPLTLAIVDGQLVDVGGETYIVPLVTIIELLQVRQGGGNSIAGGSEVFHFRGEYLPIIRLHEVFGIEPRATRLHEGLIMVVEGEGRRVGLFVDALLSQQQVVIKSMETNYGRVPGIGGATILGEGTVALILDVSGLIRMAAERRNPRHAA